jgi:putative nucleotidyltransferase with HDIG domain
MDLSDLNNPVMKKMLIVAPGTYNHSMMVATLAESACHEIGANALLARVGAYYHDLGKIEQPEYFVENQMGNNKHEELNPRLSVSVIRRHVKKGLEKATQLRLPKEVLAIIEEHHGNSLISYFYAEAKKQDPQVSAEEFSYIGTPPQSKESAVVMLADTVEAACRTLDKPSVSRLEKFIKQLVMTKVELGQLDNSGLTFKELSSIQRAFVTILAGYYHSRIEYPNQKDPDEAETGEKKKEAGRKKSDKKDIKHKTQNAHSVVLKKSNKEVKEK